MRYDNLIGLEEQLFSWTDWDDICGGTQFYNVVLKIQIGNHPVGSKFECACLIDEYSLLQLYHNNNYEEYHLKLSVGDKYESD